MSKRRLVGLVGAGVMGRRHAAVIGAHPQCDLHVVVDHSPERAAEAARHGDATGTATSADSSALARCDLVVVATGSGQHHEVTMPLLAAGIPVLVEKPLALRADEVDGALDAARSTGTPLAVGFTQRHLATWMALERVAAAHGPLAAWRSSRCSPAVPRAQGSAVLDLMIHDLDLFHRQAGGIATATWRVDGGALQATAAGDVDGVVATFHADRAATSAERVVEVRLDGIDARADLLHGTLELRHPDGTTERRTCEGASPLDLQWQWFLDLVDGHHDAVAELDVLHRVHELAFTVDAAGTVTT